MANAPSNPYDEVLYPGHTQPQTHPNRLATLATLFGMKPTAIEQCRVLELACGNGSNLIPMAFHLPESEFVGVDLAARPIAQGAATAEALKLKNITLRQLDLLQFPADLGAFDYIIAHGIYSWVPPAVQDKILAVCRANLTREGVAYVSYNAYPGSHFRQMFREMMLFHIRTLTDPAERIKQSLTLVKFLIEAQPTNEQANTYKLLLEETLEQVLKRDPGYVYHDYLADINSPVYFHQFIAHATRHGLRFLAEADFHDMQTHLYAPQVSEILQNMAREQVTLKEQYIDFITGRSFRQTLLCHRDIALAAPTPERVMTLYISSPARPTSNAPDLTSPSVEEFSGNKGALIATDFPLAKAALLHLGEVYPLAVRFDKLLAQASARTGLEHTPEQRTTLAEILLRAYATGLVEMHVHAPRFTIEASEHPVASPLARWQIQHGKTVTTLNHATVEVADDIGQQLLSLLDGRHDRAALRDKLTAFLETKIAVKEQNAEPTKDLGEELAEMNDNLEKNLNKIARLALLVE